MLSNDPAGRCLVIKLNINSRSILLFNVYFPCYESGADYRSEITFPCFESGADYRSEITYDMGFIENILDTVSDTDVIILGDIKFSFKL